MCCSFFCRHISPPLTTSVDRPWRTELALVGQFERAPQTSSNAFVNSFAAYKLICYATAWKRKCVPYGHVILFVILFVNLTHQSAKMIYFVFSFMIMLYIEKYAAWAAYFSIYINRLCQRSLIVNRVVFGADNTKLLSNSLKFKEDDPP